jgi:hypothetical protein
MVLHCRFGQRLSSEKSFDPDLDGCDTGLSTETETSDDDKLDGCNRRVHVLVFVHHT